jgi:hypothetical protein
MDNVKNAEKPNFWNNRAVRVCPDLVLREIMGLDFPFF